jgi:hypothetical protein
MTTADRPQILDILLFLPSVKGIVCGTPYA